MAYLGFSAHTGEVSGTAIFGLSDLPTDFHDIITVETKTIYSTAPVQRPNFQGQPAPKKGRGKSSPADAKKLAKKGDGFVMALFRVLMVLIIMLIGYFIWTAYRAQQADRF